MNKKTLYESNDGTVCPICGSTDIKNGHPQEGYDSDKGRHFLYVVCYCFACHSTWHEIWRFARLEFSHIGAA